MFSKLFIVAILFSCVNAQANTSSGDCYMTNSCPGNPTVVHADESAFNNTNDNNMATLAQAFAALGSEPVAELPHFGSSGVTNSSGRLGDKSNSRQDLDRLLNDDSEIDK